MKIKHVECNNSSSGRREDELLSKIKNRTERINSLAEKRAVAYEKTLLPEVKECNTKLMSETMSLYRLVKTDFNEYATKEERSEVLSDLVGCSAEYDGEVYSFKFDFLLPYRKSVELAKEDGSYELIISGYGPALKNQIQRMAPSRYRERAAIEVVHHFTDKAYIKDYDNIESKFLIDIIRDYFLYDDSPAYMSLHFDYQIDSQQFSEIRISTEESFYKRKKHP